MPARRSAAAGLIARLAAGVALATTLVIVLAGPASAHIGLTESDPANITTVDGPLSEIRLTFSGAADAVEDRFAVTAQDGTDLSVSSIDHAGDNVLVVRTTAPIPAGRTRVSWAIRSGDSHTMTGSLSFTVRGAPVAGSGVASDPAPTTGGAESYALDTSTGRAPQKGVADHVASLARWLVYAALLMCVGGLGYLSWVHRGSAAEGRRLVFYVRRAAVVVVVGAVVEWSAQVVVFAAGQTSALWSPSAWADVLGASFATGTALRLIGAGLVLSFLRIDLDHGLTFDRASEVDFGDTAHERFDRGSTTVLSRTETAPLSRLRVEASPLAFLGAALLVASEAFIGHSSTVEPRIAVLVSDAGHLVAGGLWAAGTFMLALTLWNRRRRGEPLDARLLGTRFSVMAAWALAFVGVTGLVLAWAILGGISGLWSTEFGRLLSAKVAVVAVVAVIAALGAHNHRVLVPALARDDPAAAERFRRTVTLEAALFSLVLGLTALLVVSAPS
jgi:copper transport protein